MKILIVDDQPTNLRLLRAQLETEGHVVTQAADGIAALEVLERDPVDALITDILMPRMDGYRLCHEVRKNSALRATPIVIYTSTYTSPGDEKLARDVGADAYLRKPASVTEIVGALHRVTSGGITRSSVPLPTELTVMQEYSERLIAKLEEKNIELLVRGTAMETAGSAVMITDAKGVILWTNPAFTAQTGYPAEEALGRTPRILKSGRQDAAFYKKFWATILAGETWRGEFTNRRKDGAVYYDEHTVTPVRSSGGAITHFIGIMHDVTARKQAEEEVRATQSKLRHLVDHTPAVLYALKLEGEAIIPYMGSENISRLLGFTVAETLSMDWWLGQLHPDDRERAMASIPEAITHGTSHTEYRLRHKDGGYHWVDDHRRLVRNAAGQPAELIGVWTDVTERKRAEEVLRGVATQQSDRQGKQIVVDMGIIALGVALIFVLGDAFGWFKWIFVMMASERLHPLADEAVAALGFLVVAMLVFSIRRWWENRSEVTAQRRVAEALQILHAELEARIQRSTAKLREANDALRAEAVVRQRAEQSLRESEERYRLLFEHSPDVIYSIAPSGALVSLNPAFETMSGWPRAQWLDQPFIQLIHPDDQARVRERFQAVLGGAEPLANFELRVNAADGGTRDLEITGFQSRLGDGQLVLHGIGRDITERKRAELATRRLAAIVESSADAIFSRDLHGIVTSWNRGAEKLFGYTAGEMIGSSVGQFVPADRPEEGNQILTTIARGERLEHFETLRQCKDGRLLDVSITLSPIHDASDRIVGASIVARDISEQKTSTRALELSERRFKSLFEQAAVGVAQSSVVPGRFVEVNQCFCAITGYSREELLQRTFADFTHPQDVDLTMNLRQQVLSGAIRDYTQEQRYVRKDGSVVWVNLTVSAMWAPGETPDYFIGVVQDITERKKIEEQFRQAQKMEAVGTLAGGIAHDFNNILGAINGYTELAKMEGSANAEITEYLEAVLLASRRATDLVRRILTFSRHQETQRMVIHLGPVVSEVLQLLRATIPAPIEFESSLTEEAPAVLADASQVHQVLMNLGTNAAYAMRDRPGRFTVKLENVRIDDDMVATIPGLRPGCYARLTVSDTGHGMNAAIRSRIFEPFFTTKPPGKGTGLGLSVVHGIMQNHDGVVTVYSHPGEGTTFHLYFPAHAGAEASLVEGPGKVPRGQGERVLFVDDEQPLARLGQKILERLGYTVDARTNPREALEAFLAKPTAYDLVLTDEMMPGLTGSELARRIHAIRPDLPVVLVTGYTATLTPERVEALGIAKLLLKPLSVEALATVAHQVLSKTRK